MPTNLLLAFGPLPTTSGPTPHRCCAALCRAVPRFALLWHTHRAYRAPPCVCPAVSCSHAMPCCAAQRAELAVALGGRLARAPAKPRGSLPPLQATTNVSRAANLMVLIHMIPAYQVRLLSIVCRPGLLRGGPGAGRQRHGCPASWRESTRHPPPPAPPAPNRASCTPGRRPRVPAGLLPARVCRGGARAAPPRQGHAAGEDWLRRLPPHLPLLV